MTNACACGLRGAHFACTQCGKHAGVKSVPCLWCRGFRFDAITVERAQPSTDPQVTTAHEPMQPKPQPATHARRARSARA